MRARHSSPRAAHHHQRGVPVPQQQLHRRCGRDAARRRAAHQYQRGGADLGDNSIGDAGATQLADALRAHQHQRKGAAPSQQRPLCRAVTSVLRGGALVGGAPGFENRSFAGSSQNGVSARLRPPSATGDAEPPASPA